MELSNAQKATKKVQQEAKQVQEVYFNEQFNIFLEKQFNAHLQRNTKRRLSTFKSSSACLPSHYKKKRSVNLENAKIHAKSLEVNADCALGDCTKLSELCQLVKEDPALQNLSEESIKLLKDDVLMM